MTSSAAIVGAGAIGCWVGDALAHAGWKVSMVARGATLEALRSVGMRVVHDGETRSSRPQAGTPKELGPHDYVFVTVKAQILPDLAPTLIHLLGPSSVVISAGNGLPWWFFQDFGGPMANRSLASVDPTGSQRSVFPRDRSWGAVVHASVRTLSPARAQIIAADLFILGEPSGANSARLENLVSALRTGGINARTSSSIRLEVWAKLWGNMNMNPLSALTRCGTSTMLAEPAVRELCLRMMEEMQCCAQRLDLQLPMNSAERIAITQRLGNFKTSMLVDLEAGRTLELDAQLGAIVEIAQALQIPAPFSQAVLGLTKLIAPRS